MATTVTRSAIGTGVLALTANTISEVDFSEDLPKVEVVTVGTLTADVWWTNDGTDPAVGTGYYIPSGLAAVDARQVAGAGNTVVKLISTGTPSVRVQRGDAS